MINRQVRLIEVTDLDEGQRLDNYLLRILNGVPKTRLYKAIRKGEVRVNKGRAKPETKLALGDVVRIPPFQEQERGAPKAASHFWVEQLREAIVYDAGDLLVIDKPSGLAVHGGSGITAGLIETLRLMYPDQRYLELVHRLDRDTSGLIMVAKRASVLRELHEQLRSDRIDKRYQALVIGRWPAHLRSIDAPLEKYSLGSGERRVKVSSAGRKSLTQYRVLSRWRQATLLEAKPVTGRTHQIRVHCRHVNMPILGEQKYAVPESDELTARIGLDRLFLHAARLSFELSGSRVVLEAPLPPALRACCNALGTQL